MSTSRFLHIEILRILSQHEEGDGAKPDVALETIEASHMIGASTRQRVFSLNEFGVTWMIFIGIRRNDVDVGELVVVRQESAHLHADG